MKIYAKIKKQHLFIFLVLFTALVLFTYFEVDYTGLTTKGICEEKGYQCCEQGEGTNYFSLDYSCQGNQQCWTSCKEEIKQSNLITTSAVWDNIWNPVKDFFSNLFGKGPIAGVGTTECQGKNTLFTISSTDGQGHVSNYTSGGNAYNVPVCAENFQLSTQLNDPNRYLLIKLSELSGTNSHVEIPTNTNYPTTIYIKPKQGLQGQVNCVYQSNNPSNNYECLFSISGDTDAHIGTCNQFNPSGKNIYCKLGGAVCGNGIIEPPEQCDGTNLGGETCQSLSYTSGRLSCLSQPTQTKNSCEFDTSRCTGDDTTLPTINIISLTNGTTITGTINIEATASDNRGVIGVQFKVDSSNIGTEDTTSPYSILWNSTSVTNEQHTITATARDAAGNTQRASVIVSVNNVGSQNILPLIQSDYEIYWANDGIVAFSFNKYILRNPTQIRNIQKFKVYRKIQADSQFTLITILEKSNTPGKVIKDLRGLTSTASSYEDDKYDFWDDYSTKLTNRVTYNYKVVPVDLQGIEYSNENSIIQITPQATNTRLTVSGSCNNIQYGQCSANKPSYCGMGYNLINNSGFDSDFTLWDKYDNQYKIVTAQNHKGENSKLMHINIAQPVSQNLYALSQTIDVKPNTYYKLSAYIKAESIEQTKPLLYVDCSTTLSDQKTRKFLASPIIPITNDKINNDADWTNYNYTFKTYNGANECTIHPVYFQGPNSNRLGSKGKVWIDGLRLEELSSTINIPSISNDCGICGCPAGNSCLVNGSCGIIPQQPRQEICNLTTPLSDNDGDGIKAAFDIDCTDIFDNNILIEEVTPSADEAYTNSDIKVDCKYNIVDSEGEEKRLGTTTGLTINVHGFVKDCIHAYIYSSENYCSEKEKTHQPGNKIVSFRKCNIGEIPGEGIPVICEVDEKCAPSDVGTGESFITVTEYQYCSEINEGMVEIVNNKITLNAANEPGEELKVSGKIMAAEPSTIVIESALIDLEDGQIKQENSANIEYTSSTQQQKSFEVKFTIPSIVAKNYFVFVKAYIKDDESNSCMQTSKQLKIISDVTEEGVETEMICDDLMDDDNDGLTDCEDDDCSADPACLQLTCIEGSRCDTGLPGICSTTGTQTCLADGSFGECIPQIQPGQRQEVPNNNMDENCDGQIDEGGIPTTADSDDDDLLDSWEYKNFNTLVYGPNDDPDKDGISNIEEYRSGTNPNIADEKKLNLTWLWIILGIIITIILIFILFKLILKPKSRMGINYGHADPRLSSYIQDSLRKGFTKQQIRQALISKGWSPKDIDNALR